MTSPKPLPKIHRSVLILVALSVIGIYLFATAPADLDDRAGGSRDVPVETLFRLLDAENASIRAIYTAEIVTPGLQRGLAYREDWKTRDVHAGPLPALFLRETANRLQQRIPELGLFLGSTYPIEASNHFKGAQLAYFEKIEQQQQPQFFIDDSTGRHTAMFPDIASAPACVSCHNEHRDSPRKDWKLDDVMGATTWSFPRAKISTDELVAMLAVYRTVALDAYGSYLKKTETFDPASRPRLGDRWPRDGLFLPDAATFRERIEAKNSTASLNLLLRIRPQPEPTRAVENSPAALADGSAPENAGTAP